MGKKVVFYIYIELQWMRERQESVFGCSSLFLDINNLYTQLQPKAMLMSFCRSCAMHVKKYFVDLQFMGILMSIWLLLVLLILCELGVFSQSKFVAFGPRSDLTFMHVAIDTYYKYNILICMIIVHTFVTDIIADSLAPHVLNVVQDTKNKYIPHRARTYILITTMWSIYCSVSQLFVIFIAFGQLDLLLVRLASDLLANFTTMNIYLDGKIFDPRMHSQTFLFPDGDPSQCSHAYGDDDDERVVCGDQDNKIVLFSIQDEDDDGCDIAANARKREEAESRKGHPIEKEMASLQKERNEEIYPDTSQQQTASATLIITDDEKQALLASKQN